MRILTNAEIEKIEKKYPRGTRIELVKMDDFQAPPEGTHGTVMGTDDTGSLLVRWDDGRTLNALYGTDVVTEAPGGTEGIWDDMTDIPFDEREDGEMVLSRGFHIWNKGTERSEIWRWFDERHPKGVGYLLYEREPGKPAAKEKERAKEENNHDHGI